MAFIQILSGEKTNTIQADTGTLLSTLLTDHQGAPHMFCGGKGTCGKCRVTAHGALSAPTIEEQRSLTPQELETGVRLACLCRVQGDCSISLHNSTALVGIRTVGHMPPFPKNPMFKAYGAAIDIGTTTLVAQLWHVDGLVQTVSTHNPQRSFGADVISRMGKSTEGFTMELANSVRGAIAEMLLTLTKNLPPDSLDAMVITGNTAMLYLLTGRNPDCLTHAPFQADERFGRFIKGADLGLQAFSTTTVYLPRCMSAFVGADITTAILAAELCSNPQSKFLVDIGTNGEMALWHNGNLLCCSTAAGPTFEGAGISMGMQGSNGAIDHISIENGSMQLHVIGESTPTGICGSGIVDAVSTLLSLDAIDENGFLEDEDYPLCPTVSINQRDIRMVQLAKSAICAGALTLLTEAGVTPQDLTSFFIAGGFGSYLDLDKAAHIGLYPPALKEKALVLGNAALSGAAMLLLNQDFIATTTNLANSAQTVDLSTSAAFMNNYVSCMLFA